MIERFIFIFIALYKQAWHSVKISMDLNVLNPDLILSIFDLLGLVVPEKGSSPRKANVACVCFFFLLLFTLNDCIFEALKATNMSQKLSEHK